MIATLSPARTRSHAVPFAAFVDEARRIQDEFARFFSAPVAAVPALNIAADENAYYVEADLPGVDPANLEITVSDGQELTIKGERKVAEAEGAEWLRNERGAGSFSRTITLPGLVNPDAVEAASVNGVLTITLPKAEAAKPRKIAVKA